MNPFEELIKELGQKIGRTLLPDSNQSCRLKVDDQLFVQIDLDASGDKILIGALLGTLIQGTYRNLLFKQAMCVNGTSVTPRGILAYSDKKDSLVLFHFFSLQHINGEKLYHFLRLFIAHARLWRDAISKGEIPQLEQEAIF